MRKCVLCGKVLVKESMYLDCPTKIKNDAGTQITHYYEGGNGEQTIVLKHGFIVTDQFQTRCLIDDRAEKPDGELRVCTMEEILRGIDPKTVEDIQNFFIIK